MALITVYTDDKDYDRVMHAIAEAGVNTLVLGGTAADQERVDRAANKYEGLPDNHDRNQATGRWEDLSPERRGALTLAHERTDGKA